MVDSNVVRCATSKGRSSSRALSSVLRRVMSLVTAAGIYLSVPFVPTRLNAADDPTRLQALRSPSNALDLTSWSRDSLFNLAGVAKTRRWASNWVLLVLRVLGPSCLLLQDRSIYRQAELGSSKKGFCSSKIFDSTLGYPGEGPSPSQPRFIKFLGSLVKSVLCCDVFCTTRPCRWIFTRSRAFGSSRSCVVPGCCWGLRWLFGFWLWTAVLGVRVAAMPILAQTPGERARAAARLLQPELPLGRPVTAATTSLRNRYWEFFRAWTDELQIPLDIMLDNHHQYIDELNFLLARYGRVLYSKGKSYAQYAETINSLADRKPAIRRMLQGAWDLGYAWVKQEPSQHHIAMPVQVLVSMIVVALAWGWVEIAGCLALGFGALLRPGELTLTCRSDLLLPEDVGNTINYCLVTIRDPKTRFTHARHHSARLDSADLLQVVSFAFGALPQHARLWPFSAQTLRVRFRSLLAALGLPTSASPGLRALDLGSLRAGGATWIIQMTENGELCRRRGRWASVKIMEIYVQETIALQYMKHIDKDARQRVLDLFGAFWTVFDRVKSFQAARIPHATWFFLISR